MTFWQPVGNGEMAGVVPDAALTASSGGWR